MRSAWLLIAIMSLSLTAQGPIYSQRPRGEPQTGKAFIEGTVIDASTREPIKKASVMLMGSFGLNAVTDASGHFAFRQLPPGQYTIRAQSDKYPPATPGVDDGSLVPVPLAVDEQKLDVRLTLTPGASIRGRIVDDEGNPMPRCSVAAMQFRYTDAGRTLDNVGFAQSDDIGEYRMLRVRPGKYYIMARCFQTLQIPHPFIRRSATVDVPMLTYAPQFYPGVPDPAGATKVEAPASANIAGIDFRMSPATGVTVRGHAGPLPADRFLQIVLQPKDAVRRTWQSQNARINGSSGEFRFQNVTPGSYELIAMDSGDGHVYFARVPIEIGVTPLDPIEIALAPAPSISGTISIEGDGKVAMNNLQVRMEPVDYTQPATGDAPQAEVQNDGTFTIKSVVPGHWRLLVSGGTGYVKSVVRGDQDVGPEDIEIGPAAAGPLKILVSMKFGELSFPAQSSESGQYSAIVWRGHSYRDIRRIGPQGPTKVSLPPGKYHVCATGNGQALIPMNRALLEALESVCEGVEVSEGGSASVQMRVVTAQELKRMMEKLEE